jgi:hypothetical protein
MKTRCDYCGGRFGLTRHKWLGYQFCNKECELAWRAKREAAVAAFRRWQPTRCATDVKQPC